MALSLSLSVCVCVCVCVDVIYSDLPQISNRDAHFELRNALIEHLWENFTNSDD